MGTSPPFLSISLFPSSLPFYFPSLPSFATFSSLFPITTYYPLIPSLFSFSPPLPKSSLESGEHLRPFLLFSFCHPLSPVSSRIFHPLTFSFLYIPLFPSLLSPKSSCRIWRIVVNFPMQREVNGRTDCEFTKMCWFVILSSNITTGNISFGCVFTHQST